LRPSDEDGGQVRPAALQPQANVVSFRGDAQCQLEVPLGVRESAAQEEVVPELDRDV
jgi:hypothetical protein